MTKLINLASENKLIYIGCKLHSLKGILIKETDDKEHPFVSYPVVDNDWRVITEDKEMRFNPEEGYHYSIIGTTGEKISITNYQFERALQLATNNNYCSLDLLFRDAKEHNLCLTDEGVSDEIPLTFCREPDSTFFVLYDGYSDEGISTFPLPTVRLDLKAKDTITGKPYRIFDPDWFVFQYTYLLQTYARHFNRKNLHIKAIFEESEGKIKLGQKAQILQLIDKINRNVQNQ